MPFGRYGGYKPGEREAMDAIYKRDQQKARKNMSTSKTSFANGGSKSTGSAPLRTGSKSSPNSVAMKGSFAHNGSKGKGKPKGGPRQSGMKNKLKWVERP